MRSSVESGPVCGGNTGSRRATAPGFLTRLEILSFEAMARRIDEAAAVRRVCLGSALLKEAARRRSSKALPHFDSHSISDN